MIYGNTVYHENLQVPSVFVFLSNFESKVSIRKTYVSCMCTHGTSMNYTIQQVSLLVMFGCNPRMQYNQRYTLPVLFFLFTGCQLWGHIREAGPQTTSGMSQLRLVHPQSHTQVPT